MMSGSPPTTHTMTAAMAALRIGMRPVTHNPMATSAVIQIVITSMRPTTASSSGDTTGRGIAQSIRTR